jgi:hypothetical protein
MAMHSHRNVDNLSININQSINQQEHAAERTWPERSERKRDWKILPMCGVCEGLSENGELRRSSNVGDGDDETANSRLMKLW